MESLAPEYRALLWGAGLYDGPIGDGPLNEPALLQLAAEHRVIGRLARRLRTERPPWASRRLLFAAWKEQREIERRHRGQMWAAQEIALEMRSTGHPIIVVKGPAVYACAGDSAAIRLSGDLDIFHADLPALYAACRRLGYSGDLLDMHEYAKVTRPGVCLELHRHVIVPSYPPHAERIDPAEGPPRHWFADGHGTGLATEGLEAPPAGLTFIRYEDLEAHSIPGRAPGTEDLAVPDPALCAVIACAHEFREFVVRPWSFTQVKLSALAEIRDMALCPGFDACEFSEIIRQLHAGDAVCFAGSLLESFSGTNPLPPVKPASKWAAQRWFPQTLTPKGPWAAVEQPADLLHPFDVGILCQRTGAYPVCLPCAGDSASFTVSTDADTPPSLTVLMLGNRDQAYPFSFTLARTESGIALDVDVPGSDDRYEHEAAIISYDCRYMPTGHFRVALETTPSNEMREDWTVRTPCDFTRDGHAVTEAFRTPTGWHMRIALAWSGLTEGFAEARNRPLTLRLVRWVPDTADSAQPVVCVPLSLTLASPDTTPAPA